MKLEPIKQPDSPGSERMALAETEAIPERPITNESHEQSDLSEEAERASTRLSASACNLSRQNSGASGTFEKTGRSPEPEATQWSSDGGPERAEVGRPQDVQQTVLSPEPEAT